MDNTSGSSQEDQESSAVSTDTTEPEIGPSAQPEREESNQGVHPNKRPIPKRLKGYSVVFEGLVAISAIAGLVMLFFQLLYMGETNRLTRESNRQTQEANERTLRLMEESNRLTREALAESRRQAQESLAAGREQSEANLEVSRRSLADSRRTMEETQRARLVVDRCESPEGSTTSVRAEVHVGSEGSSTTAVPSHATVHVRNTGALPASDVRWTIEYTMLPTSAFITEPAPIPRKTSLPRRSDFWRQDEVIRAVIGGGATNAITVKYRQPGLGYPAMSPFVHGRIDYIDGFDQDRVLRFCWYFDQEETPATWKPCHSHNWVN